VVIRKLFIVIRIRICPDFTLRHLITNTRITKFILPGQMRSDADGSSLRKEKLDLVKKSIGIANGY